MSGRASRRRAPSSRERRWRWARCGRWDEALERVPPWLEARRPGDTQSRADRRREEPAWLPMASTSAACSCTRSPPGSRTALHWLEREKGAQGRQRQQSYRCARQQGVR